MKGFSSMLTQISKAYVLGCLNVVASKLANACDAARQDCTTVGTVKLNTLREVSAWLVKCAVVPIIEHKEGETEALEDFVKSIVDKMLDERNSSSRYD
jgi:hypothetical protein